MASIKKRGDTYTVTVSAGYDINGKQLRNYRTYKPDPGLSQKQIDKELNRIAVLFEEQVQQGIAVDGSITFADFVRKWMEEYAVNQLKATTYSDYQNRLNDRILPAIGHIKLCKLQPHHLISFYDQLLKKGVKKKCGYKAKAELLNLIKKKKKLHYVIAEEAGIAVTTLNHILSGCNVQNQTVDRVSKYFGKPADELFKMVTKDSSLSNATIAYYHHVISSILTTAVQWQIIPLNPAERVKPPRIRNKEAIYLEEDECLKVISALEEEPITLKTMVMLVLYTGMRRGEMLGLTWDDIDFVNNKIDINKSRLYVRGVGVIVDTPKNETSKRVIGVPQHITDLLVEYRNAQAKNKALMGDQWTESEFIFTSVNGKPIHPDTASGIFTKFIKRHELPAVHLHSLRHTNASLLIANGVDIKTVSTRLGHSNTQTTGIIYTHQIRSADERATEQLDKILNKN